MTQMMLHFIEVGQTEGKCNICAKDVALNGREKQQTGLGENPNLNQQ